ncbi:glutamine-synthetase adenylyltransferase [Brevirhabdus pacifica]|uniref:Glutamine-synthetase adenylyltransferase n=1 Tax=Brevirhabdus pacifica TaxID=1267768 RepID=A0A1U7DET5_9RHOB|nr:glutamine-synthetase adenylyltransferase [Brevirhabdus pacifica]APX88471.1 glutamine-synthetase adenylyltransferase [Brevirhabdus pacifica]PJJ87057.1 glutamate-ammonia-ligase adenylyltransferase [Brevirhabdus pacifica]
MDFASRITRNPIPHDPDRGADVAGHFTHLAPELTGLIGGAAGCSPYLAGLLTREAEWLSEVLQMPPQAARRALMDGFAGLEGAGTAEGLRRLKGRMAVLVALADLGGIWDLEQVTGTLTEFADRAVQVAIDHFLAAEIRRGKLPGMTEDDLTTSAGLLVLAMGKMGAGELNYSSDIDLICLFDESRYGAEAGEARAVLIRVVRRMAGMLSDLTDAGYVFRTDLRLRPDPSVTPVCLSMDAAERYYESEGRTWERAAYIKARAAAGDLAAGQRFLDILRPFVWRRHLDFVAIQDAHDMRLRIRAHKGLSGRIALEGHDMKLGVGGIREIEFFTQTHQLISGGRDADLRVRGTVEGLARLAEKGWIEQGERELLAERYAQHREVEHRLQMLNDAQTHQLPRSPEGFDRLARFMGEGDTAAFRARLEERLGDVARLMEPFFAPDAPAVPMPDEVAPEMAEIIDRWPGYPALRSERAVETFGRLRPGIIDRLNRSARPQEALIQFDQFLKGLPAGVQLFALFDANRHLVDLLIDICATAPGLASHLSRNPGVLDAVLGGSFFEEWPGAEALGSELSARLAGIGDYEDQLVETRRWSQEWHFRIGVHHLRGLVDAETAGRQYADLARAVLTGLWPAIGAEFARRHGPAPGRGAVVLGMGSLGAGSLNAASDLDLIVIYDADGVEASDGRRPLAARTYYARLTQALVTALSARMAGGQLYEVDMRLRPSGRQGPVATSLASFTTYQSEEAWTWEHLALTRAVVVAGAPDLAAETEVFRRTLLAGPRDREKILADWADMRRRLAEAKPARGPWDVKSGPGGLQDIELAAQAATLLAGGAETTLQGQLDQAVAAGIITEATANGLDHAHALQTRVNQGMRLLGRNEVGPEGLGRGAQDFLLRETGEESMDRLVALVESCKAEAAALIEGAFGIRPGPDRAPAANAEDRETEN